MRCKDKYKIFFQQINISTKIIVVFFNRGACCFFVYDLFFRIFAKKLSHTHLYY